MRSLFIALSITLLLHTQLLPAQSQGHVWYFGDHAGLDFATSPPTILTDGSNDFQNGILWNEGCSSISDAEGNFLFHSNGEQVWDRNQNLMPNGDGLLGHSSSTSAAIIIPIPESDQLFYLFTCDAWEDDFENGLRYSIIDLCLNDQFGDVTEEKNIVLNAQAAEKVCAAKHDNGVDYWLIVHERSNDAFLAYLITAEGIESPVQSNIGPTEVLGWGGQMLVSPNREMLAYCQLGLEEFSQSLLLDFDASTGLFSNHRIFAVGNRDYGISFSPDNSKVYVSTLGFGSLRQYDLNAGDWAAVVDSESLIVSPTIDNFREQRLGPDGKIYISRTGVAALGVIEDPNAAGLACNYVDAGQPLGSGIASFGLPFFLSDFDYHNQSPTYDTAQLLSATNFEICSGAALSIQAIFDPPVSEEDLIWSDGTLGSTLSIEPIASEQYLLELSDDCLGVISFTFSVDVVHNSQPTVLNLEICEGETLDFEGQLLVSNEVYNYAYTDQFGCDSLVQILTTELPANTAQREIALCPNESYNLNGQEFSAGESTSLLLPQETTCDSLIEYTFFEAEKYLELRDTSLCLGQPFIYESIDYSDTENPEIPYTAANGCDSTILFQINRDEQGIGELLFPNSFSPNGDGQNDSFGPLLKGQFPSQYSLQIFDRWGKMLFESSNPEVAWDGSYKGEQVSLAVFVWYCRYEMIGCEGLSQEFEAMGNVTGLR